MLTRATLALLALSVTTLSAQDPDVCQPTDNEYPITFVDRDGNSITDFVLVDGNPVFTTDSKEIYMALPADFPTGTYYVQVTDSSRRHILNTSTLAERTFSVTNNAGVISVVQVNPSAEFPGFGAGLGGVGDSIPLFPLTSPDPDFVNDKGEQNRACTFKAWIGECYVPWYDSNLNPEGLPLGIQNPDPVTGHCCVRSYESFQVGDLTGSDLSGTVFLDLDRDGVLDAGEPGCPDETVSLYEEGGALVAQATTDASGQYAFSGLPGGAYHVVLEIDPNSGFLATTPTDSGALGVCGCAPETVPPFGKAPLILACAGRTPGFWSNNNGRRIVDNDPSLLTGLGMLHLVDADGNDFDPASSGELRTWLRERDAVNMAYQLSAHLAAMYLNVEAGFVNGACLLDAGELGGMSVAELMARAEAALVNDSHTPTGDPNRRAQELLKNALDDANNNLNWL